MEDINNQINQNIIQVRDIVDTLRKPKELKHGFDYTNSVKYIPEVKMLDKLEKLAKLSTTTEQSSIILEMVGEVMFSARTKMNELKGLV